MLLVINWCYWLVNSYFDPEECLYMTTREDEADDTRLLAQQQLLLLPYRTVPPLLNTRFQCNNAHSCTGEWRSTATGWSDETRNRRPSHIGHLLCGLDRGSHGTAGRVTGCPLGRRSCSGCCCCSWMFHVAGRYRSCFEPIDTFFLSSVTYTSTDL